MRLCMGRAMSVAVMPAVILGSSVTSSKEFLDDDLSKLDVDGLRQRCIDLGLKPKSWVAAKLIKQISERGKDPYAQYALSHERNPDMPRYHAPAAKNYADHLNPKRTDLDARPCSMNVNSFPPPPPPPSKRPPKMENGGSSTGGRGKPVPPLDDVSVARADDRTQAHARRLSLSKLTVDQLRKTCLDLGVRPASWVAAKLIAQIQEAESGGKYDNYKKLHERDASLQRLAPPPTSPRAKPVPPPKSLHEQLASSKPVTGWQADRSPTTGTSTIISTRNTKRSSNPGWMRPMPAVDLDKNAEKHSWMPKKASWIPGGTRRKTPPTPVQQQLARGTPVTGYSNQHDANRAPSPTDSITSTSSQDILEERRKFIKEKEAWEAEQQKLLDMLEQEKLAFEREQMEQEKVDWEREKRRIDEQKAEIERMRLERIKARGEELYAVPTHASSGGNLTRRTDLDSMYDEIDEHYRGSDEDLSAHVERASEESTEKGRSFGGRGRRFSGCSHISLRTDLSEAFTDWSEVTQTWAFDEAVDAGNDLEGKTPDELKGILQSYGVHENIWDIGKLKARICQARAKAVLPFINKNGTLDPSTFVKEVEKEERRKTVKELKKPFSKNPKLNARGPQDHNAYKSVFSFSSDSSSTDTSSSTGTSTFNHKQYPELPYPDSQQNIVHVNETSINSAPAILMDRHCATLPNADRVVQSVVDMGDQVKKTSRFSESPHYKAQQSGK